MDDDPALVDVDSEDSLVLEEGGSVTFLPMVSVRPSNQIDGWTFSVAHSAFQEILTISRDFPAGSVSYSTPSAMESPERWGQYSQGLVKTIPTEPVQ